MQPFVFARAPYVHFGVGKVGDLARLVAGMGNGALVVSGRTFSTGSVASSLFQELRSHGVKYDLMQVSGEPTPELIDREAAVYRAHGVDVVLAIGGGSALDAGKAMAAMLPQAGTVEQYLEGMPGERVHDGRRVSLIAVPTTAGTGSEATKNAVLSRVGEHGFKRSVRHDNLVPDIAVVDPQLSVSCPPELTAACGMDAFTQLLESYVSTKASAFTDALALSGMEHVRDGLLAAYRNGADIVAREHMSYAALLSGITLANAGLGVVHGFASSLGGFFDIPHGIICGTLVAPATRANIEALRGDNKGGTWLSKYADVGRLLSAGKLPARDMQGQLSFLLDTLDTWADELHLPALGRYGMRGDAADRVVAATGQKNNPVKLSAAEMKNVLLARC